MGRIWRRGGSGGGFLFLVVIFECRQLVDHTAVKEQKSGVHSSVGVQHLHKAFQLRCILESEGGGFLVFTGLIEQGDLGVFIFIFDLVVQKILSIDCNVRSLSNSRNLQAPRFTI
jgi:hypothetical protein